MNQRKMRQNVKTFDIPQFMRSYSLKQEKKDIKRKKSNVPSISKPVWKRKSSMPNLSNKHNKRPSFRSSTNVNAKEISKGINSKKKKKRSIQRSRSSLSSICTSAGVTSLGSKEHFYYIRKREISSALKQTNINHEIDLKMKNQNKNIVQNASVNNWSKTLHKSSTMGDFHLQKKKMKFGHLSSDLHCIKVSESQSNLKSINKAERHRWKCMISKWSDKHGFVRKSNDFVTAEDFQHYFRAFKAIASKAHFLGDDDDKLYFTKGDIHHIATQLGIAVNSFEVCELANIMDSDGSQKITFVEFFQALRALKKNHNEPYIGGQITFENMLLAYARKKELDSMLLKIEKSSMDSSSALHYLKQHKQFKASSFVIVIFYIYNNRILINYSSE